MSCGTTLLLSTVESFMRRNIESSTFLRLFLGVDILFFSSSRSSLALGDPLWASCVVRARTNENEEAKTPQARRTNDAPGGLKKVGSLSERQCFLFQQKKKRKKEDEWMIERGMNNER